jgi:hypothetical protein
VAASKVKRGPSVRMRSSTNTSSLAWVGERLLKSVRQVTREIESLTHTHSWNAAPKRFRLITKKNRYSEDTIQTWQKGL